MDDPVAANRRRGAMVIAAFAAVTAGLLWSLVLLLGGGTAGLLAALAVSGALALGAWRASAPIALAMSHARPADPIEHARLHNLVEGLCVAAGLPKPAVLVVDDDALNAFTVGRHPRHAAIVVTTGLLATLNRIELEGVVAHELSHVKNHDIVVASLAVTTVGLVALVADWALRFVWWGGPRHRDDQSGRRGGPAAAVGVVGVVALPFAPLAARAMQLALSPRREALADVTAVSLTRYPPGLIAALEKLRDHGTVVHSGSLATAHLWIESPVPRVESEGHLAWLGRRFDTHPPMEERIQALREL